MPEFLRILHRRRKFGRVFYVCLLGIIFTIIYCEYLIYFVVQSQCDWSSVEARHPGETPLRALILADTHLLGRRTGHWLDKMRREWQMHRAFQTAVALHNPEIVFVLGDLLDEGQWCTDDEFSAYVDRFHSLFRLPDSIPLYATVGNHDIGFHYRVREGAARRFERRLEAPPARLLSVRGIHFVLLNSMALEGDGCSLCARAVTLLHNISDVLRCSSDSSWCGGQARLADYSPPVLMQHFPLYRESDEQCAEGDAPAAERVKRLQQRWDCLSEEATDWLLESVRPRVAFGGHTHHACRRTHTRGGRTITEHSVASFSHRNRASPHYLLASFTRAGYSVSQCRVPAESTLLVSAGLLLGSLLLYVKYSPCYLRRVKNG